MSVSWHYGFVTDWGGLKINKQHCT